jgi:hypothetical protein
LFFLTAYTDRFTALPVAFEISNALLLEEPSMYSENNKSAPTPEAVVVTFAVLLEAETFPAASSLYGERMLKLLIH